MSIPAVINGIDVPPTKTGDLQQEHPSPLHAKTTTHAGVV
jgi:hypothetical protein